MKRSVALLFVWALSCNALPQSLSMNGASQNGPAIAKLPPPSYPRIALAAHVSGDVVLDLAIRRDGTIESAVVASGPPMLREAAVEIAQQTLFGCARCTENPTQFRVIFRFELGESIMCSEPDPSYPRVSQSTSSTVTIAAQPFGTCDPASEIERVRARAIKCLFLWKCAWSPIRQ